MKSLRASFRLARATKPFLSACESGSSIGFGAACAL